MCHQFRFNKVTALINFYCDNIFLPTAIAFYIYESLIGKIGSFEEKILTLSL